MGLGDMNQENYIIKHGNGLFESGDDGVTANKKGRFEQTISPPNLSKR